LLLQAASGSIAAAPMTIAALRYAFVDTRDSSFAVYRLAD
jgi:hypothetical protein